MIQTFKEIWFLESRKCVDNIPRFNTFSLDITRYVQTLPIVNSPLVFLGVFSVIHFFTFLVFKDIGMFSLMLHIITCMWSCRMLGLPAYCKTHNVCVCLYIAYIACGSPSLYIKTLYFFLTVLVLSATATVANVKICYDAKTPHFAIFGTRIICVLYSINCMT